MSNVLLVAGSRSLIQIRRNQLFHIFDNLSYTFDVDFNKIIHGGAKGVDQAGGFWATEKGYEVEVFPANWDTYGKRAGYLRNAEMSYQATHAIIVWDGTSKGARNMFDICIERELPTAMAVVPLG